MIYWYHKFLAWCFEQLAKVPQREATRTGIVAEVHSEVRAVRLQDGEVCALPGKGNWLPRAGETVTVHMPRFDVPYVTSYWPSKK